MNFLHFAPIFNTLLISILGRRLGDKRLKRNELFTEEHYKYLITKLKSQRKEKKKSSRRAYKSSHTTGRRLEKITSKKHPHFFTKQQISRPKNLIKRRKGGMKASRSHQKLDSYHNTPISKIRYNKKMTSTDAFKPETRLRKILHDSQVLETKIKRAKIKKKMMQQSKMARIKLTTMKGDIRNFTRVLKESVEKERERKKQFRMSWLRIIYAGKMVIKGLEMIDDYKTRTNRMMKEATLVVWAVKRWQIKLYGVKRWIKETGYEHPEIEPQITPKTLMLKQTIQRFMNFGTKDEEVRQRKIAKITKIGLNHIFMTGIRERAIKRAHSHLAKVFKGLCKGKKFKDTINLYNLQSNQFSSLF